MTQGTDAALGSYFRPYQLQHHPVDLDETYVRTFRNVYVFGYKAWHGKYVDPEYLIARCRYLLTTVRESHISDLLFFPVKDSWNDWRLTSFPAWQVGAWIAGMLKYLQFIDQILYCVKNTPQRMEWNNRSESYISLHASMILMGDEPKYIRLLAEIISGDVDAPRNNEWITGGELAFAAMLVLDERNGTKHSAQFDIQKFSRSISIKPKIVRFLDMSELMMCGFHLDAADVMQSEIAKFIATATPVEFQALGVMQAPFIRHFEPWCGEAVHRAHVEAFKAENEFCLRHKISISTYHARDFRERSDELVGYQARNRRQKRDLFLMPRLLEWLQNTSADLFWVRIGAGSAKDAYDIVASLEMDVHGKLPVDIVDFLYEKLAALVSFDAGFMRQYAYDLMLRSNAYDKKAIGLLEKADEIEAGQRKLSKFPKTRMVRDSRCDPNFPFRFNF
jgi:hypothetical protein